MKKAKKKSEYEEEINLMDYVKVILKRKRLISATFFIIVIVVGTFSWVSPKVYKIDTTLEIGKIRERGGTEKPFQVIETPSQIVEKINGGVYGWIQGMKVSNPKDTNLIKIEATSKDPIETKEILAKINESILANHNAEINSQKNLLEEEIERLQEKIDFLISEGQETAILQLEINNLQREKGALQSTKIIREPTISEKPVKPRLLLNTVIAGILGILIGVFWAFFQEWWEENKEKS